MAVRLLRIGAIALVLSTLIRLSQRAGEARGNEALPSLSWALGVLGVVFLLRALVTELSQGTEADRQKDLLWGVAASLIIAVVSRL